MATATRVGPAGATWQKATKQYADDLISRTEEPSILPRIHEAAGSIRTQRVLRALILDGTQQGSSSRTGAGPPAACSGYSSSNAADCAADDLSDRMQLLHSVGWLPDCGGVSRPRELSCQPVPGKLSGAQPGRMGKALPASQQLPKAGQNRVTASSVSSVPSAAARVSGGVRARQLKHSGALVPSGTSAEGTGNHPTSGGHSQGRMRIYAAAIAAAAEAAAVAAAASCARDNSRGNMKSTATVGALLSAHANGHDDVRSNAKDTQLSHDDDTGSAPVFATAHVMGRAAVGPHTVLAAPATDGVDAFAANAAAADDSAAAVREAGAAAAAASDNSSDTWLCWRSGSGQDSGCDDVLSCSVTCWHAASPCAQPPVPSSGAAAAAGAVREAGPMQYAYNCGGEDDIGYQYEYEAWGGPNAGAYCQVASDTDNGVLFWISPESTHQLAPAGRPQSGNATGGNGGGGGGRIPPPSSPCDVAAWAAAAARADASAVAGGAAAAMRAGMGAGGRAGGSSGNMWVEPLDVCYMMRALEPWVCATPGGVLVAPADSAPHTPYCAYPYERQQPPPPPPPHVSPLRPGNGGMGGAGGGGDGGHVDSYGLSAADGVGGGGGGVRTAVTVMILGEEATGAGEEAEAEAEADLYVHVLGDSQTGNCVGGAGIGCGRGCAAGGAGVMDLLMAPVGGVSAGNVGVVSGASEGSSSAGQRGFAWTELFGCTSSNGDAAAAAPPPLQSVPPTAAGSPAAAVTGAAAAAADERCLDAAGVAAEEEGSEFGGAAAAGIVAIDGASEGARAALVTAARGGEVMQVQPVDILRLTLRSNEPFTTAEANYSGGVFTAETETATAISAAAAAAAVPVVPLAARRPPQPLQATAAAAPPPPPPPPPPALCVPGVSVTDAAALAGSADDLLGLAMDVHQFYEEEPGYGCRDSGGGVSGGGDSGGCQARGVLAVAAVAAAMPPPVQLQQLQQLQSEQRVPPPLTPGPHGSSCVMSVGAVVAAAAQPAVHGAAPRAAPPSALGTLKAEDDDDAAGGSSAAAAAEPPPLDGNEWCQRPRREVRAVSPAGGSAAPMSASAIASTVAGAGASGPTALALPPRSSSAVESARPGGTAGAGWGRWSRVGGGGGGSAKGRSPTALTFGRKLQEGLEAALVKLGAVGSRRRLSGDVGGTRDGASSAAARRV